MSAPVQPVVHTPGPWRDDPHDINGDLQPINTRNKGWTKIRGENGELVVGDIDVSTPVGEANLRLIASSPMMLNALRRIVRHQDFIGGSMASMSPTRHIAAQAIQHATGEVV